VLGVTGSWYRRVYQRRSSRPAAILVTVLAVIAVATWSVVLSRASTGPARTVCPPPAASPTGQPALGAAQSPDALDAVAPAAPSAVRIRVLNGGGQRGQANLVASQLGELGFTEAADPTNDPYYPDGNLTCRGNIRYGPNGAAGARTVSLVLPCLALVPDTRPDDTVDVAIGSSFGEVHPSKAARDALDQLGSPAGRTDAGSPDGAANPVADPDLLSKAREVPC
jgi:LytR cell envelope-related transcriptional attenuator